MKIKNLTLVETIKDIDPINDHRWVPDGENAWFLPCILDLVNHVYGGYWYTTQNYFEASHAHTGLAYGSVLKGEILLGWDNQKQTIKQNESFLLQPNTAHTAELVVGAEGFLFFGVISGDSEYPGINKKFNAESYYTVVKKQYDEYNISLEGIVNR